MLLPYGFLPRYVRATLRARYWPCRLDDLADYGVNAILKTPIPDRAAVRKEHA